MSNGEQLPDSYTQALAEIDAALTQLAQCIGVLAGHDMTRHEVMVEESRPVLKAAIRAAHGLRCGPNSRLEEAERIIFWLTADHNSGPNYVKGFDMAREYFAKYPSTPDRATHSPQEKS